MACDILQMEAHTLMSQPGVIWQNDLLLYLGWRNGTPVHEGTATDEALKALVAQFEEECTNLETRIGEHFGLERIDKNTHTTSEGENSAYVTGHSDAHNAVHNVGHNTKRNIGHSNAFSLHNQ